MKSGPILIQLLLIIIGFANQTRAQVRCPAQQRASTECLCEKPLISSSAFAWMEDRADNGEALISCIGRNVDNQFHNSFWQTIVTTNNCDFRNDTANPEIGENLSSEDFNSIMKRISATDPITLFKNGNECDISKMTMNQTSVTALKAETFGTHRIRELVLLENYNLVSIEPDTLAESKSYTKRIEIRYCGMSAEDIMAWASTFSAVEELVLRLDGFQTIKANLFDSKPLGQSLIDLDLSKNHISHIEDGAFNSLIRLKHLRLNGNNLHAVANWLLFGLPRSRDLANKLHIHLQSNRINEARIEPKALAQLIRPVALNLSQNLLTSLPEDLFKNFFYSDHRNMLDVGGNPFLCDQSAEWIGKHIHYLNYSRGGTDDDVNINYRVVEVDGLVFLYERKRPDFSYYKIRGMTCEDGRNIFER